MLSLDAYFGYNCFVEHRESKEKLHINCIQYTLASQTCTKVLDHVLCQRDTSLRPHISDSKGGCEAVHMCVCVYV